MESEKDRPQRHPKLFVIQLLTGCFIISILLLNFVAWTVVSRATTASPNFPLFPLLFVGVALIGGSFLLPRVLFRAKHGAHREDILNKNLPALLTMQIIILAIREAGAICGFVATLMSVDSTYIYTLSALAVAAILADFPTYDRVMRRING